MLSTLRGALVALTVFAAANARAQDADPFAGQPVLEESHLVRAVLARNRSVAAARAAVQAAASRPEMAGALMDPMLSFEVAPLSAAGGHQFGAGVGVSQKVPFPGKRGLREEAAGHEAKAAEGNLDALRLSLAESARRLYADWFQVARALEVNAQHRTLLAELKRAAEAAYTSGTAPQADLLQAELMIAELEQEAVELEARAGVVRVRLNALLHRAPDAPLPPAPAQLEATLAVPSAEEVRARALERHPALAALAARVAASEARVRLAEKAWLPDLEVMGSYSTMWEHPEHRLMVGVGVELPLQVGARRAEVAENRAMAESMRHEREQMATELVAMAEEARQMLEESTLLYALQKERVLPAARANLEAARAAYVTGRSEFQAVIEAERAVRTAELRLHATLAEVVRRRAALDKAVGQLPSAEDVR